MKMYKTDANILQSLIGTRVRSILIPTSRDSVSPPVETVIVLNDHEGVLIDSCAREPIGAETDGLYPQLRVRLIHDLPRYPNGRTIELNGPGEIVRSVELTHEEVRSPFVMTAYTKGIRLAFGREHDITITRQSFRSPSLQVFENDDESVCSLAQPDEYTSIERVSI